jgi:2',3'-cyclic-nucleotide 2'-phosphodiesterase (5'-nucleotidase family)
MITGIGGSRVGVTCVSDTTSLTKIGFQKKKDYIFRPLNETLKTLVAELSPKCDFIIVLSQLPPDENTKILELFPQIDLIVESFGNKRYDPPVFTQNGIIVSPGSSGQFVGQVTLKKDSDGKVSLKSSSFLPVLNYPEDEEAHKIVMEYYTTIK